MFVMQMILTYGGTLWSTTGSEETAPTGGHTCDPFEAYGGKGPGAGRAGLRSGRPAAGLRRNAVSASPGRPPSVSSAGGAIPGRVAGCLSVLAGILCRTEKQVILAAIFGAMVFSALGGCWWPIEIVPETFKSIARLTPSYWAMQVCRVSLFRAVQRSAAIRMPGLARPRRLAWLRRPWSARLRAKASGISAG